jgi:hypothetical protein
MSESEGQNKTADGAPRPAPAAGQSEGAMLVLDAGARRPLQGDSAPSVARGGDGGDGPGDGSGAEHGIDEARMMARVRGLYRELLDEPVPQEFMRLIRALEDKERSK